MNLILAESRASVKRLEQIARIRSTITTVITPDAKAVVLGDPLTPLVVLASSKAWPTIWTRWGGTYRVPPIAACEAVRKVVTGLLSKKDVSRLFGGAFKGSGFVWGCVPGATGIYARERVWVGGGGLFLEHYLLCRVAGLSADESHVLTTTSARAGGVTPLPARKEAV